MYIVSYSFIYIHTLLFSKRVECTRKITYGTAFSNENVINQTFIGQHIILQIRNCHIEKTDCYHIESRKLAIYEMGMEHY